MSIVGTRPPLISETNLYEPHHKARLAIKLGITGMWQVSGEYLRMLNKRMHLGMLTPVEAFLEHDPKIPYDNSGTEWHISYYSEEDRKRIDTVMQSYGCENYTLHPDIAQCIETFKK